MRVLHIVKTTQGAKWALLQMRELVKLNTEVHVVLPDDSGKASEYKKLGIQVHILNLDLGIKGFAGLFSRLRAFRKLICKVKPDIVHSHFFATTLLMRLALKGMQVSRIFQVPGPLHLEHSLFRAIDLMSADKNDVWIGTCEWTTKKYQSMIHNKSRARNQNKVFLSYYGTDVERFNLKKGSRQYLYDILGIEKKKKIIGIVAYMYPPKRYLGQKRGLKGHEDLIDAVSIVRKADPDVALVVVGSAWGNAKKYEKSVEVYGKKKLGRHVFFMGFRSDVARLYSGFDVAVHPSHSENVGGAVESLLMRIPTITSNIGGFPDVIKHGRTGLLAESKNPEDLAQKILCYLKNSQTAKAQAQRGFERVFRLFDVKRTAKEIQEIYQSILTANYE